MPNELIFWILLIVLAALITGLALWLGRGFEIRKDEKGFSIAAKEKGAKPSDSKQSISVGKGAEIKRSKVGDIAGIKTENQGTEFESVKHIDVLEGGEIKDSKVGDIVGFKVQGKNPESKS